MFNVFLSGNYLKVITPTGKKLVGAAKNVEVIPSADGLFFTILNLREETIPVTVKTTLLENIPLASLADQAGTPYDANSWNTFYQNNTATIGAGGGASGGLTNTELRASAVEITQPTASLLKAQTTQQGTWTVQPGNTANTTPWLFNIVPNVFYGYNLTHHAKNTAGSTMLTSVKGSPVNINNVTVQNLNATTTYYLKLYNKATAPVLASDIPVFVFAVKPLETLVLPISNTRLGTGIAYAVTGGIANTDTTAVATANDIIVNINYI